MRLNKRVVAAFSALILSLSAFAAEGGEGKEEAKPVGPPQPSVIEPFKPQALPPRSSDPSWILCQEGIELYGEKRFGEAILAFKKAIDTRSSLSSRALADLEAAMSVKEAPKAMGSLSSLLRILALKDMIPQAYEKLHAKAGGSLVAELELIRESSPSGALRGLIDASLLVAEEKGISRVGDSLAELKLAVKELAQYPEAEYWLGKIYLAEGETRLAELQIRRAYDMRSSLELPSEAFAMLDSLAGVYKARGETKAYEDSLRAIADASDLFAAKDEHYRNSMERILERQGFDTFMKLYRVEESFPIDAYSDLGALYLEDGRPIATIYLAAAANACLTRAIREIRVDEPGYEYAGLDALAMRIAADRGLAAYANEKKLWKDLVLLGDALFASGNRQGARELWTVVKKAQANALWGRKAAEELEKPSRFGK
jgi:hypothetical protein